MVGLHSCFSALARLTASLSSLAVPRGTLHYAHLAQGGAFSSHQRQTQEEAEPLMETCSCAPNRVILNSDIKT